MPTVKINMNSSISTIITRKYAFHDKTGSGNLTLKEKVKNIIVMHVYMMLDV